MRALALLFSITGMLWFPPSAGAQTSGTTRLVLHVEPDAFLNPVQVRLQFRAGPDAPAAAARQTELITARVRALSGQRVHLLARVSALAGPDGPLPASFIQWTAEPLSPAARAGQGTCTSGTFEQGALQDLVAGWNGSGAVSCALTFWLRPAAPLPSGVYSGLVDLILRRE